METKAKKFNSAGIPDTLKKLNRWLNWKIETRFENGETKLVKVPHGPNKRGELIHKSVTNPDNWYDFETAAAFVKTGTCDGVGFALADNAADGIKVCCVDVDHCVDADGNLNDTAKDIISIIGDTYVEISQSGGGVHIFFVDNEANSDNGCRIGNVELYSFKRFIATTGNAILDFADDLTVCNGAANRIADKYLGGVGKKSKQSKINVFTDNFVINNDDLNATFDAMKHDDKFQRLFYEGDTSEYDGDDSAADMALMAKLCWLTNGNRDQMTALFLKSALGKRDKATRADYIPRTIDAVLETWDGKHYSPKGKFLEDNAEVMSGLTIPENYIVTDKGITKITVDSKTGQRKFIPVTSNPIVISGEYHNIDTGIFKTQLSSKVRGNWRRTPILADDTFYNAHKLTELRAFGLPVNSTNANEVVKFLEAFRSANENAIPLREMVNQCGWRGNDFVTPFDDRKYLVDDSGNSFVRAMKQAGDFDKWLEPYRKVANHRLARFITSTAFAPPLLNIVGERSFCVYIYAPTRSGKTTINRLTASTLGTQNIIRIFNSTKNAVELAAAECNDFCLIVDEKELADKKLSMLQIAHIISDGQSKGRGAVVNKEVVLRDVKRWRVIGLLNGETPLLDDNATGGGFTRVLQIYNPNELIPADLAREVNTVVRNNYGFAFPRVLKRMLEDLQDGAISDLYFGVVNFLSDKYPDLLPEHIRYISLITVADTYAQTALLEENFFRALDEALEAAFWVCEHIETKDEVSDVKRAWDWLNNWYSVNLLHFETRKDNNLPIYGEIATAADGVEYLYINAQILKEQAERAGFSYKKIVQDLISAGYFKPADTIAKGAKSPNPTIIHKIGSSNARCYRIPIDKIKHDK